MFVIDEDMTIHLTRGDGCVIDFTAYEDNEQKHIFANGDVVRFLVTEKKDCGKIVLSEEFTVIGSAESVAITLTGSETKIGDVISKPVDYWYEVKINPESEKPQTPVGYDKNGAKVLRLYPEGGDR